VPLLVIYSMGQTVDLEKILIYDVFEKVHFGGNQPLEFYIRIIENHLKIIQTP